MLAKVLSQDINVIAVMSNISTRTQLQQVFVNKVVPFSLVLLKVFVTTLHTNIPYTIIYEGVS